MTAEQRDTVIIGAGPSGLAVAGCLAHRGLDALVIERAAHVASAWHTHYKRLHLHTAKQHSGLPFVPWPDDAPTYPSRQAVVDYLTSYAARFGIQPRFATTVTRARPDDAGRGWVVETNPGDAPVHCRHLVVASGYNGVPHRPTWPGLETFQGEVVHSADYGDGARFAGQNVLVVGAGNSGGEIAIDLWEHGARPILCIRGPLHVVPRDILGRPAQSTTILLRRLPPRVADTLSLPLVKRLIGDLSAHGIVRPRLGPLQQIAEHGKVPLIDVGTVDLIKQGAIRVAAAGIREVAPGRVTFDNGATHEVDAIVLATGYRAALDRFLDGAAALTDDRGYPTVFGAEHPRASGLFFVGFKNPWTGALRESALEAQRVAAAIAQRAAA